MQFNKQQVYNPSSKHVININDQQEKAEFHKTLISTHSNGRVKPVCSSSFWLRNQNLSGRSWFCWQRTIVSMALNRGHISWYCTKNHPKNSTKITNHEKFYLKVVIEAV